MASPNALAIETLARDWSGDNDATSTNWSVDKPTQLRTLNRFYLLHKRIADPWVQEIPATVSGLTFTAGVNTVFTTSTTIREIRDLFLAASAGSMTHTSEALERCDDYELDEWALDYVPVANEPIRRFSRQREGDYTKVAGSVGIWRVRVNPTPAADSYLIARCVLEPSQLVNDTDVPDLSDDEGMGLATLLGAWQAGQVGNDHLVDGILRLLPASMQATAKIAFADHPATNPASRVGT